MTAEKLEAGAVTRTVGANAVPATAMILDVGPQIVARIAVGFEASRTLVWNGPVGAFETAPFERATVALAKKAAELTHAGKLLSVAWPVLRMENLDTDLPLPPEAIPVTVESLETPPANSWLPFTGDHSLRDLPVAGGAVSRARGGSPGVAAFPAGGISSSPSG